MDIALLNAMLHSSHLHQSPLLVVAASLTSDIKDSLPPVQIAEWLSLIHVQHPWQVILSLISQSYSVMWLYCGVLEY